MKYKVIVETGVGDSPYPHELKAALIVANEYFKADVLFLRPTIHATPDIECKGVKWEIKSPTGSGKKTIENNLRNARKQSSRIIVDFTRIKLHQSKALANIEYYLKKSGGRFDKVIIISKAKKVIEIL